MKAKLVAVFAVLALASPVLAQGGPGAAAATGRRPMMRNFDPSTVTTVSGEVMAVRKIEGRRNAGTHVDLKAADATYDVHMGPAAFLTSKSLEPKKGDQLEVTGSKLEIRGKPALIAQTVKKGDTTVTLRDAQGVPAWAGARKRR